MKVKVCGITSVEQMLSLEQLGVDYAGLIFYDRSPRYVGSRQFLPSALENTNSKIKKIGVFVNAGEDEILKAVDEWNLEMVQLHGEESPVFCERISNHVKTIKAFRVDSAMSLAYKIAPYQNSVEYFLFDAMGQQYGGTGNKFNWELLVAANIDKPFFLSGGIAADDVELVNAFSKENINCFAVDVNSKFEITPGVKNMETVKKFVDRLNKI
jgi:phosphoribosylanthranilate isomerase